MMVLTLFGNTNAKINVEEIVEKTKNGTVVHVASWERMTELFTLNSLCACDCDLNEINYTCGSKVAITKNGRESIGYAMKEEGNNWIVAVRRKDD